MKKVLFLTTVCLLTVTAVAEIYIENFEYPDPPTPWFTSPDGFFNHQTTAMPPSPTDNYAISNLTGYLASPCDGQSMLLWNGLDTITFNLLPDQYVESVSLDYFNLSDRVDIIVTGTELTYTWSPLPGQPVWQSIDTTGMNFGQITQIVLSTEEAAFDNIAINVVPEPTTLVLLGLGGLMLRKRSR